MNCYLNPFTGFLRHGLRLGLWLSFSLVPACGGADVQPVRIVLLGDSITAGGHWNQLLGRGDLLNRGVGGDRTGDMLARLQRDVLDLEPQFCLIMAGANDGLTREENLEAALMNMEQMMERLLAAGVTPVLQSVLYVGAEYPGYQARNAATATYIAALERMAGVKGLRYLDLNAELAPEGVLHARYTQDGLHLVEAGYEIWARRLRELEGIGL